MSTTLRSGWTVRVTVFGFLWLGCALCAQAVVSHTETPDPVQQIPAVDTFMTTGAEMAGMSVTVFFANEPEETEIWTATGADSGEAAGTTWRLSQAGDTFLSPWTLIYEGPDLLIGFRIDGFEAGAGNIGVMFDRAFPDANGEPQFGTPGSFHGRDFQLVDPVPFNVFVNYQGAVGVAGDPPVGDEFRWLNVRFRGFGDIDEFTTAPVPLAGLGGNIRSLTFIQDTNNVLVPEPASWTLLGLGVLAALLERRRRSR